VKWLRGVFLVLLAVLMQWIAYVVAAIGLSYWWFLVFFVIFLAYSVLLCSYSLWNHATGKICRFLDRVVETGVRGRKVAWWMLLWVGTIATWAEVRNRVTGHWPDAVLVICVVVVGVLTYEWLREDTTEQKQNSSVDKGE
jgi:membrane protein implicated in regulation of membrane protease activity